MRKGCGGEQRCIEIEQMLRRCTRLSLRERVGPRVQFSRRVCRVFLSLVARPSCAVGIMPVGVRETPRYLTSSTQRIGSLEMTMGERVLGSFY